MEDLGIYKKRILEYADMLKQNKKFAIDMPENYFKPGMMEHLERCDGAYNADGSKVVLCFELKGTRYEERTYNIEHVQLGDKVFIEREPDNAYNPNNFIVLNNRQENIGVLPAELCNIMAPLYDAGKLKIVSSSVSYIEHILERSRYATKSVVFCGLKIAINDEEK